MTDAKVPWKTTYLVLLGLVVLAAIIAIVAYVTSSPKTTIRITKGRPGAASVWNVESGSASTTLSSTEPVDGSLWRKMNETIDSFRYVGCDGVERSVMVLNYRTAVADDIKDVVVEGTVGSRLKWDFSDCGVTTLPCKLPARYFDPTYYGTGEKPCGDPASHETWTIVLR